jgi:ISXO2 transposase-like protein
MELISALVGAVSALAGVGIGYWLQIRARKKERILDSVFRALALARQLGGERNGGKRGRGSPGKTPIVAAVETTPNRKPIRLKLRRVKGFRRAEIATLAQRNFHPASTVVSDGCTASLGSATPAAPTSRSSLDPVARPP